MNLKMQGVVLSSLLAPIFAGCAIEPVSGSEQALVSVKDGNVCGKNICAPGNVCCNVSCGICTPPGGVCTQQYCGHFLHGSCEVDTPSSPGGDRSP
jgi:hypothetical protein